MNEHSPFDSAPDDQLGAALRDALPTPFGGAFVNRVLARLRQQRPRSWDEELAGWFWQGLVAASLVTVLAGWGLKAFGSPRRGRSHRVRLGREPAARRFDAPAPTCCWRR